MQCLSLTRIWAFPVFFQCFQQACRKFKSFRAQHLDFLKFPQKCVTRDIQNCEKDWMICNIKEEITRNWFSPFWNIKWSISTVFMKKLFSTNSTDFQLLAFYNLKIFLQPVTVWPWLFACMVLRNIIYKLCFWIQ